MALTSTGLGSGLNVEDLVSKLVAAEREQPQRQITQKAASATAKLTALGTLRGALANFQSAARALNSTGQFLQPVASSSDASSVTASASPIAGIGSQSIEVSQLAQSQRIKTGVYSSVDAVIGTGTLLIDFGSITDNTGGVINADANGVYSGAKFTTNPKKSATSITIDAQHNTLNGVRDAVNSANAGVTASIINDGSGYRLVLSSNDTGASNAMRITVADGDGASSDTTGLSSLAYNPAQAAGAGQNLTEVQAGKSAKLKVNGIAVTNESNTASDIVTGLSFNLLKVTTAPVTINVGRDSTNAGKNMEAFVKSYNELKQNLTDLSFYDPASKQAGVLQGEAIVRTVQSQLRGVMNGVLSGGFTRLADVGVGFAKSGAMTYDSTKFAAAVSSNAGAVASLFGSYGVSTDSQVRYFSATTGTQPGNYAVQISQIATQASLAGSAAVPVSNIVVDSNNDSLTVNVDGTASGAITLTAGTYATPAAMAAELQSKINADATLSGAGVSVAVSYDNGARKFIVTSNSTGVSSNVSVLSVDTNTASTLGLTVASGTAGSPGVSGALTAAQPLTGSVLIDADNDTFTIKVDGISSAAISLNQGTYASPSELANAMQSKINGDVTLKAAGAAVSVVYDSATGKFQINSSRYGAASTVAMTSVDTNSAATLGLDVATGTAGLDVAGSIGMTAAVGNGQYLTGAGAANGLKMLINGGSVGNRGSVAFNRGFAFQLDGALDTMLSANGSLTTRTNSLNTGLKDLEGQMTKLNKRLGDVEKRYRTQFTSLDVTISRLQQTSNFLTQQLSALSAQS
ncbi:flagellar hook protein FliD [Chitinimonas arctica]|uniref:Flagellar hook-associated protein 2 n=1 Tax=Chitinimonas arctica TaxID=2594795 RepID=A0A516SL86_9NEIS|nr:flagellar filament capping protein FliD [Chitinimonas arctica]QDQ28915.1 flagellar hook protein FliD [Chitinimonas arctica]